jgi:flagellar biogenesis protein FliO
MRSNCKVKKGESENMEPSGVTTVDPPSAVSDGDWSYLRSHLDQPNYLSGHLSEYLSPQGLGGLGERLASWLMHRRRNANGARSRLVLLARLPLGPRQAVALIEADGIQVLVGTSPDGSPTFLPLRQGAPLPWIETSGTPGGDQPLEHSPWGERLASELRAGSTGQIQMGHSDSSSRGFAINRPMVEARIRSGPGMRRGSQSGRVSW